MKKLQTIIFIFLCQCLLIACTADPLTTIKRFNTNNSTDLDIATSEARSLISNCDAKIIYFRKRIYKEELSGGELDVLILYRGVDCGQRYIYSLRPIKLSKASRFDNGCVYNNGVDSTHSRQPGFDNVYLNGILVQLSKWAVHGLIIDTNGLYIGVGEAIKEENRYGARDYSGCLFLKFNTDFKPNADYISIGGNRYATDACWRPSRSN